MRKKKHKAPVMHVLDIISGQIKQTRESPHGQKCPSWRNSCKCGLLITKFRLTNIIVLFTFAEQFSMSEYDRQKLFVCIKARSHQRR